MVQKILVVDDNDMNRMLVRDVLANSGYEIIEAKDGREGVRMAREHLPDLVLMDVQMPVMNGMAAAKILKADPATKHIKIVSLTGYAMGAGGKEFQEAGFDDYLAKPLDIRVLAKKVRQCTGNGRP